MDDFSASQCHYKIDLPYPPVQVNGPNPANASLMLGNMADRVSEMSASTHYFYISVVTKPQHKGIAQCFHDLSIVEMHHLQIFSELALLLGADPRLWSGRPRKQWWSPSYITYPKGLGALITGAIEGEKASIRKYTKQANTITDYNIVAILDRIIRDEERHVVF